VKVEYIFDCQQVLAIPAAIMQTLIHSCIRDRKG
jgi:hypothetical protein